MSELASEPMSQGDRGRRIRACEETFVRGETGRRGEIIVNEPSTVTQDLTDRVVAAWAEALDIEIEAVPLDRSFFEAGGNSLLLLLLSEQLNELTVCDVTVGELFQHSTVRAQTEFLTAPATASSTQLGATTRRNLLGRAEGTR